MLPIVNQETYEKIIEEALKDINIWRKSMIHYIKDENPEVNTAILEISKRTELDPKAVATGAYMTYLLLEKATGEEDDILTLEE